MSDDKPLPLVSSLSEIELLRLLDRILQQHYLGGQKIIISPSRDLVLVSCWGFQGPIPGLNEVGETIALALLGVIRKCDQNLVDHSLKLIYK